MKNFETKVIVVIVFSVSTIGILEGLAIVKGIDGTMFGIASATIGGMVGYVIKELHHRLKK